MPNFIAAALVALLAVHGPAFAQHEDQGGPMGTAVAPLPDEPALIPEGVPVETPAAEERVLDPEAATRAYLDTVTGEARERSDAYFEGGYVLNAVDTAYTIVVAAILLFLGISGWMRDMGRRVSRFRTVQTLVYAALYIVVTAVLGLPFVLYRGFFREHEYGLSNQTLLEWGGEYLISLGVGIVMFSVFIAILYAIVRWTRERWWIWGTGAAIAFFAFALLISPVYIDPLFNEYKPLEDGPLKERILSIARANGIEADQVYQFDASKQTTRISANVSGLFGTMRIALNDNLLNRGTEDEIVAVVAHEIGHYVLNHIYELMAWIGLVLIAGFAFVNWAFRGFVARFGSRWRVEAIDDPAGLPLAVALFSVYFWVITPVWNTMIRVNEAEADIFGLNAAREPDAFATIALKLAEYRKLEPGPVEEFVFYDHPSGRSRILMAMRWKAENPDAE